MKDRSLNYLKPVSLLVFLLSISFYVFFDKSKHIPALAQVNPFSVDPYDAVGSFGIQVALFGAILSVIRAYRPYTGNENIANQELLIVRGELTVFLSVIVTLAADILSMLRHLSIWIASPAGGKLGTMVAGMLAISAITGLMIFRAAKIQRSRGSWRTAMSLCFLVVLILAVYPSGWDEGVVGGILTAVVGMLLFFSAIWALLKGLFPEIDPQYEDLIDDLIAIYYWIKGCADFADDLFKIIEKFAGKSWIRPVFGWLNPRQHAWNLVSLIAITTGVALALVEALGEGVASDPGRAIIVVSVFIGLEGAGILLGYGLLARFLGIYRSTKSV